MNRTGNWIAFGLVGVLAAGVGFVARGAIAGDEAAGPTMEKPIDGHALVKALAGTWTTKATSTMGPMAGEVTYALDCGKTILTSRYLTKADAFGEMNGLGVLKFSADGKTATQWWFDTMADGALEMTGPLSDTGYTIEGKNKQGSSKITLTKKGDGFEMKMWANGEEFMTETYTKKK
jgi:hypothetical protein